MILKVSDQLMKMLGLTLPPLPSLKQKSAEPATANISPVVVPPPPVDVVPGFNPSKLEWKKLCQLRFHFHSQWLASGPWVKQG